MLSTLAPHKENLLNVPVFFFLSDMFIRLEMLYNIMLYMYLFILNLCVLYT